MVTAVVLLTVERSRVNEIAEELAEMKGVTEVFSVAGQYDLIAVIRTRKNEGLAGIVTEHMLKINGIVKSETLIVFKVYSKHDLEGMFSIGMDD